MISVKKIIASFIVFTLLLSLFSCGAGEELSPRTTEQGNNITDFEIIKFGRYEQDNDTSNGPEEIEWLVLEKKDGKALVICKYGIACQQYHNKDTAITWEKCSLRKWLNGVFFNEAFSEEEQEKIPDTVVIADINPYYDTSYGNDTNDKIFILSVSEVEKYFTSDEARKCVPSKYADKHGVYTMEDHRQDNRETEKNELYYLNGEATCTWWTRSFANYPNSAVNIIEDGSIDINGYYVNFSYFAVRPAMWIDLDS